MSSLLGRYSRRATSLSLFRPDPALTSQTRRVFDSLQRPALEPLARPEGHDLEEEPIHIASGATTKVTLPDLPPLPPPRDPDFRSALAAKFALIRIPLCFADPKVQRSAKKTRFVTIQELFTLTSRVREVTKADRIFLFDGLSEVAFRQFCPISPYMLFSDDIINFVDHQVGQINLLYQSLLNLTTILPAKFDLSFIQRMMTRFVAPDRSEATMVATTIYSVVRAFPDLRAPTIDLCVHEITGYFDRSRLYLVLFPALSTLLLLMRDDRDCAIYTDLYRTSILPVVVAPHFSACAAKYQEIIEMIVDRQPCLIGETLGFVVKRLPKTKSAKTMVLLGLLGRLVCLMQPREFREHMIPLFRALARCLSSPHVGVVSAACAVWRNHPLEQLVLGSSRRLFPIIYAPLTVAMDVAWAGEIRACLGEVLEIMNKIDSFAVQGASRARPDTETGARVQFEAVNPSVRNWAIVAREAGKNDRDMNLGRKLAEIQTKFVDVGNEQKVSATNSMNGPKPLNLATEKRRVSLCRFNVSANVMNLITVPKL